MGMWLLGFFTPGREVGVCSVLAKTLVKLLLMAPWDLDLVSTEAEALGEWVEKQASVRICH